MARIMENDALRLKFKWCVGGLKEDVSISARAFEPHIKKIKNSWRRVVT